MAGSDVLPLHDEWVVVESSVYMETGGVLGVKIQSFSRCGAGPPVYGLLLSKTVSVTLFGWRRTPTSTSDHMCAHIRAISSKPGEHLGIPQIVSLRFVAPWPQFWWKLSHVIHIWPSPRNPAFTWGFPDLFTSIRCSMALVFVESVAFRIEFAHRAIPLKPSMYLGIPRSFHFDSLLFDKS